MTEEKNKSYLKITIVYIIMIYIYFKQNLYKEKHQTHNRQIYSNPNILLCHLLSLTL